MRWRVAGRARGLLALALLGSVVVAGCGSQYRDAASRQQQSTSLADVRKKIELIELDRCYTGEPHEVYPKCAGRYLTEVNNAALVARSEAETTGPTKGIGDPVGTIRDKINDFNGHSCATVPPASTGAESCAADLRSINVSLDQLARALPQPR